MSRDQLTKRLASHNCRTIAKNVTDILRRRDTDQNNFAATLREHFKRQGRVDGWPSDATFNRFLNIESNPSSFRQWGLPLAVACAEILNVSLEALCGFTLQRNRTEGLCDPAYERLQLRGREHPSECAKWARQIENHARQIKLPTKVYIVPTNEYTGNPTRLAHLGNWGAEQLQKAVTLCDSKCILVGLGKHVSGAVQQVAENVECDRHVEWLPAMSTYNNWDYFSANALCFRLSERLGGKMPVELTTVAFIPINESDDAAIEFYYAHEAHQLLFGNVAAQRSGYGSSAISGRAYRADTTITGCGIAAAGNPLWQTPRRFNDPELLRLGEYPAVGDLNGHYLCVRRDGIPVLLSTDPFTPDAHNREAWDANRRALGANPTIFRDVAKRYRSTENPTGRGVIVMANAAGRAPAVYAMLKLGIANRLVIDYDCAESLIRILHHPDTAINAVPEYADW